MQNDVHRPISTLKRAATWTAVGVVSLLGFSLTALLLFYALSPWIDRKARPFFGSHTLDTALFGISALASGLASVRFLQGRRWAWWTALVISSLTLTLGVLLFWASIHPHSDFEASESGFGIGVSLMLMTPGGIGAMLLIMPSVRRRYAPQRTVAQH